MQGTSSKTINKQNIVRPQYLQVDIFFLTDYYKILIFEK